MKRLSGLLITLLMPLLSMAKSIDEKINEVVAPITDVIERIIFVSFKFDIGGQEVGVPIVLVWLVAGSLFFTLYFIFIS